MKYSYTLLTLISASFVLAAPAPFVETGPVASNNVLNTAANFGRRGEAAHVQAAPAMGGQDAQAGGNAVEQAQGKGKMAKAEQAAQDAAGG